jgi:formate dehydrogenase major subunit
VLIKRTQREARRSTLAAALPARATGGLDRRDFLRRSGLAAGALGALGTMSLGSVRKAEAGPPPAPGAAVTVRKNVCTHCSVGCTVIAKVANGVTGWADGPVIALALLRARRDGRDANCCRLRYPMKLVNGAISGTGPSTISDKLMRSAQVQVKIGLLARLGQVHQQEAAYLNRKLTALGNQ